MRTTLALDDVLLEKATSYTGLHEKSALLREALKALIEREAHADSRTLEVPSLRQLHSAAAAGEVIWLIHPVWVDHLRKSEVGLRNLLLGAGECFLIPS